MSVLRGARIWLATPALIATAALGVTASASASPRTTTVTTVYVANLGSDSLTPINTATGTAGAAIRIPGRSRRDELFPVHGRDRGSQASRARPTAG